MKQLCNRFIQWKDSDDTDDDDIVISLKQKIQFVTGSAKTAQGMSQKAMKNAPKKGQKG